MYFIQHFITTVNIYINKSVTRDCLVELNCSLLAKMWMALTYVVRFDSSRVAARHSSPTPHFDQGCVSTRVKSNYIHVPHRLYIIVYEPRQRAAFKLLAGREFRKIGHLVTSFYNFAWCYIYVYCLKKIPQTKWGSPLAACMHTIQNGHHP